MNFSRLFRNVISSWVGYAATLLVAFLLAPLIVHRLGTSGYGVWTLVVSLTGYCGLLDLGLRSALMRFVSRDVGQNDPEKVNRTLSSAMAMLASAGMLALLGTLAIHSGFAIFKVDAELAASARTALLLCGLNISLILPLSVFSVVLPSMERYDVTNAITVGGAMLRAALVVTVLHMGFGIVALSIVTLVVTVTEYGAQAILAKAFYPALRLSWRAIDISQCKELFSFGAFRFIWIVANQLIFYTDSVVIGLFLNVGAITTYAIAGSLINYGRNVVSLATNTLFPAANRLDANKDLSGLRNLYFVGTRLGSLVGLALCTGYVAFGETFIHLWMGEDYVGSARILIVLTLSQFTSMSQYMSALILVGMGRHRFMAFLAVTEAVVNLCLSIVLVKHMGLIGVAWGTAIPHVITTGIVIPYVTMRALQMAPKDFLTHAYLGPLLCAVPAVVVAYFLAGTGSAPSWAALILKMAVHCAIFGLMGYVFCLGRAQKASVREGVLRAARRFRRAPEELARPT